MEPNHIYQFSLLTALMSGVSDSGIPVSHLLSHLPPTPGTVSLGLGTFLHMSGEMLLLNNTIYQLLSDGTVRVAGADEQLPFAVATNFLPQQTLPNVSLSSKDDVIKVLDSLEPHASGNLFVTFLITGTFDRMKCRTVKGQTRPGESLSELGKSQVVSVYEDVEGTVVGVLSPEVWQGFTVAGGHMHFIDDAKRVGGHVLELQAKGVRVEMAVCANVHVELPTSGEFRGAKLVVDDGAIKGAES